MLTLETLDGQTPLEIVQSSTFSPLLKLKALLVAEPGLNMFAEPVDIDHKPVPRVGELAASAVLGEVMQRFWAGPAAEASGISSTRITSVAVVRQPPLLMVHSSVLVPDRRPVTVLVSEFMLVTVPPPEVMDQVPIPSVGVLPVNVVLGELIQSVCVDPTLAGVPRPFT